MDTVYDKTVYFAARKKQELAQNLLGKADSWYNGVQSSGMLEKLRNMWAMYHGAFHGGVGNDHQITFGGEQGELTNLSINHIRNLGQHMLVMTTSSRPSMEARSINTDYRSLCQTKLANGLLDYYMREKRLEIFLKRAVEYAIVFGAGFIKMEWNASIGEIVNNDPDTNDFIREGDVVFSNLSPLDVVVDGTKETWDNDWILVRTFKNRFSLIAKYPELADKLRAIQSKGDSPRFNMYGLYPNDTDDIPVYEFYHIRNEAMQDGRYMMFCSPETVMYDGPMPYRVLPVFRIAPSDFIGTPYGYTPLFDLVPIQEAVNSLYSTILSNQNAFGVQNIMVPKGGDIAINQLAGGLNVIEVNYQQGEPKPLNLTQTPPEIFKFIEMLEKVMETISGINSVARGNPGSELKSGTALAMVQAQAIQFISGLQQSYVQLIEDTGTALIKMLQDFADSPRVAAIVGKSNKTELKEFKGDDISAINRVVVDVGNPLARTTSGRIGMADQLLQYQLLKNPQDYITILNTGNLSVATEDTQSQLLLVKAENEKLVEGEIPQAVITEQHLLHIQEHSAVLCDPELKKDAELTQRVLGHIQQHIDILRTGDPQLLTLLGQQPLQAPQAPPPQGPGGPTPTEAGQSAMPDMTEPPGQQGMVQEGDRIKGMGGPEQGVKLPNVPTPPEGFENMPTNAADNFAAQAGNPQRG